MANIDNEITITLSAFDMMNILGTMGILMAQTGFPTKYIEGSFDNFTAQVLDNCSEDAMNEAVAELQVQIMLSKIK